MNIYEYRNYSHIIQITDYLTTYESIFFIFMNTYLVEMWLKIRMMEMILRFSGTKSYILLSGEDTMVMIAFDVVICSWRSWLFCFSKLSLPAGRHDLLQLLWPTKLLKQLYSLLFQGRTPIYVNSFHRSDSYCKYPRWMRILNWCATEIKT